YNADGGESSMCGNGGRCLVKAAFDFGLIRDNYTFIAVDGVHEALIQKDGTVALKMNDVDRIESKGNDFVLDTGSPHYVQFSSDVEQLNVFQKGREIRYSSIFEQKGINVNFVERNDAPGNITVRTYERGVEEETFSCGTGVTAAALVCYENESGFNSITVQTRGGILRVDFEKTGDRYTNIWLNGPAEKVFEGTLQLALI
ncbi:MAG TPA: diaminopimelate epimerase, partial [Flavisolibacter sp.]|nr:diaminopimelate epimerase [Flavisolibacter sp.]